MKITLSFAIVLLFRVFPSRAFHGLFVNKSSLSNNNNIRGFASYTKVIRRHGFLSQSSDDEAAEFREALKGIEFSQVERKTNDEIKSGNDGNFDKLFDEAFKGLEENPDIQELQKSGLVDDKTLREALDEGFEQAVLKIKETADEIREEEREYITKKGEEFQNLTFEDDEKRIAEAESKVSRMVSKVNAQTKEVEEAMQELQDAKEKMNSDPFLRVSNFRNVGLPKQAAFAMSLLLLSRSLTDLLQITGFEGSLHLQLALVQGLISAACAAFFFFA